MFFTLNCVHTYSDLIVLSPEVAAGSSNTFADSDVVRSFSAGDTCVMQWTVDGNWWAIVHASFVVDTFFVEVLFFYAHKFFFYAYT